MTDHYQTDLLDLRRMDCMDLMRDAPDNHWDLAIVDPPYGIGDFRQTLGKHCHREIKWNDRIPEKEYFEQLNRVSRNRIIWGVNYYTDFVKDVGRIVHDKTGGGLRENIKQLSDVDLASHSFGVNMKLFRYLWQGNMQGKNKNGKAHWNSDNSGPDARVHPCQKPIALYKWLLQNYAKPGNRILDTHMGSGSIAIACHYMGFHLTATELDEDYFTAAVERIKRETAQTELAIL